MKSNMEKGFLLIATIIALNFMPASMFAQDIEIADGGVFTLSVGSYSNTISSTTQNNASTATVLIGNAAPATVTLSGDHTAYYGLFTFSDGSTLNYTSAGPLTVPAKVNLGNNTTATTFVKKNAAFTLSGNQSDITFQIGSYGVLDLSDASNSGNLTLAKDLYFASNTDANSYIKYRLGTTTYKIISTAGKIYTNGTAGVIDVSKKFVFDMTDVTAGTSEETRNFTIATCQTLPVVTGTPTAINAGNWANFAVTVTGTGPYNIVFSATYPPVAPTTQASLVAFSSVSYSTMTVGWTNGNGSHRAVFMKEGAGAITNATDTFTYTASADWTSKGTQLGTSGYYCIYNGNSNTVDLTGLTHGTIYYVQVFEYNGPALGEKYNVATATDNPNSQTTLAAYFSDGTNYYGTWSEVASGIASGGTATMLADYTQLIIPSVTITTSFTLDLDGHTFGGAQTSTIADSKSLGLKGSTGTFDGVISFAATTSALQILSDLTFGTNFTTAGSSGGIILGDGTTSVSFACDNGDALFTPAASLSVKSNAVLALGEGTTYIPDIIIEDGGLVKLTSDASTYPNNFSTTTSSSTSTAALQIGNSTAISTTLTGDMAGFYGRVTMVDGSQLVVNMAVSGKYLVASNGARFEVGGSANTLATTLSFVAGLTLNNGDITGATNSITIGKYGVLKLTDLTGALIVTYGDIQITDPTNTNHGVIQFGIAYATTLTGGSFDIGTSIDVSSHFTFDMDNHVGTFGQTESFTFANTHSAPPSLTGTPAPINADHWSDFSVTTTAPPTMTPSGWPLKLNALYYTPVLYVDVSKTDDSGDGLSWANAKQTLQAALDLSVSGYQIWVKEGTYYPSLERGGSGVRFKTFQMIDGVAIYGGFDLTTPEATFADRAIKDNPTILSGDLDVNDLYSGTGSTLSISNNSGNSYSVVRNDVVVAAVGPTAILDGFIIKGGNADGVTSLTYGGGGMHNNATNPTIRNCRFEYNSAKYGGAFFSYNSTSAFYNCVFVNNNGYATLGGAIYNNGGSGLAFNNCDIANNYSANLGGVISYGTSTVLNNSIIWGNYSVNSGHQINCVSSGNITLNYSCYQNETNDVNSGGGTFTATNNNITTDPKFVDVAIGVFSIAGTSSCVDLGNDTYNTLTTDIRGAGFGRKLLKTDPLTVGTIDIGAYEYKFGTDPASNCEDAITVLNTNDAGAGSLRQAMLDICEDGIITFNESLGSQTITLTSGELPTIDLGVTIDASTLTSTITVDANNASRIFNINCAAPAIVNIKNLTLINASTVGDGGGIYVASNNIALDLLDVDITGCDAANGGAIYQTGGTLGANSCGVTSNTATTNGGAVYVAAGTFTSTFSQYNFNTALYGGGLFVNSGTIELTNDSLLTNSASLTGGGFYLKEGSLTLSNSKVNRNTALTFGAGGYEELGSAFLLATTSEIMGNICTSGAGAGLFVGVGFAEISQSTINGNRAEGATDWGDGGAIYVTDGNLTLVSNIIKYNYAYRWGGALVLNGLAFRNGTPATIHSTNDTISCNSAQTGVGGAIYLYQGNSDFTGTKIEWNESSNYGGGVCVWNNTGTTTFDQSTFSNNRTRNNASDVLNYGGAMFIDNAVVGVTSSTFTSNICSNTRSSATPKGGAVYVYDGTFNATNSIFTSNVVTNTGSKGGAVFNDMADVNIASCTFTTNAAGRNGGAIFTNQSTANTSSTNSTFTSNSAGKLGGALYLENGTMTSNYCEFALNSATGLAGAAGGAINHNLGTSTTKNCEIYSNTADVAGGFYLKNGTANIVNSLFYDNSASTYGGALYVELSTAVLNITNTTIASNSTNEVLTMGGGITSGGGGIANQASTGITLHNTLLWNNITFGDGAQIANIGSTPIVLDYCSYSNYTNDVFGTLTATNSNTTFPNFVDPSADDYRLGGNSSSADAGLNSYCSESYDIRGIGFSRFRNKNPGTPPSATIDFGAYEYQLTIDPLLGCTNPTNGGQITSDQSGCVSFDPEVLTNFTLPSGENGTLEYKWQQSTTSATAGFVDIASSTFSTYDPGTVSVNTWFRRLARVSCMDTWLGAIASNAVEMLIYPTSVGGTISGTSPITYGESTGTLTLSGFTGDVLKWQHKYGTAEFGDISGTTTSTCTETPVSAGTWTYRAEVQSGVCSSTWSDEFVVTVDKKTLTTSGAVADTKIYDGNTDATITGPVLIGIVSFGGTEDDVDLVQPYTGTFTTEIVGTRSVTASLSLAGVDKDNYNLTQPAGLSAEITAKELTVTGATAVDKVYDGNTDAVISGASLDGIVDGDVVTLDDLTGIFESYLVGTHTVTATLTITGTDADNYTLTQPTGLSAEIYPGVPASFTLTGPASVTAGTNSENFTIQVYDAFDNPTYCDETTCFSLTTTSNGQNADFSNETPCIGVDVGSTTFTYTDSKTGSFTIRATFQSGSAGLAGQFETATIIVNILPWIHANIGASNGTTEFFPEVNAGTYKQTAQGISAPKSDVHNFVYQQLCGNGTVIVRLDDVQNGGWAGVMMRESNAPGAKAVYIKTRLYNPSVYIGYRSTTNGNMTNVSQTIPLIHWMKIQRSGNSFMIYTSYNGTSWIRRYTATVAMTNCINAGFFTENIVSGRTTKAWFDHAEVVGYLKTGDESESEIMLKDAFEINFYPNPTLDKIMIEAPENMSTIKMMLISAEGVIVETKQFNSMEVIYNLQHIKPGFYLLRFEKDGLVVNKRLIVL